MSQYKVGIIGCGWVGVERHLPSYEADPRASIEAVYDHKPQKAKEVAESHGVQSHHGTLSEFFERDLDLVSICTPPWTHAELAIDALESDMNVLTEKPMAMSPEDAEEMVETSEQTGNKLGVVHNFLYADSMIEAKERVNSGDLGEIQAVYGFQTSSSRRHLPSWYQDLPGGLFYDESPHLLYLIEEFLDDVRLDSVSSRYDSSEKQSLQMINATLKNQENKLGVLTMLFDAPLSEWHFTVVGTEMMIIVDIFRDIAITLDKEDSHNPSDVLGTSLSAMLQETTGMISSGVGTLRGTLHFGMDKVVSQYLDALDNDEEPPISADEGAKIVYMMHDVLTGVDQSMEDNIAWDDYGE